MKRLLNLPACLALLWLLCGCASTRSTGEARNRELIRRYFAEWANQGDAAAADELIAPDVTLINPPTTLHCYPFEFLCAARILRRAAVSARPAAALRSGDRAGGSGDLLAVGLLRLGLRPQPRSFGCGSAALRSLAEYKASMAAFHTGFPDLHFTVEDLVAAGDRVAVRWTLRGT